MKALKAANRLGVVFFPAFDWAISPTHPERQERLLYTQDQLREEGIFDIEGITEFKPDVATPLDVYRSHFVFPSVEQVVTDSHFISAGGAIKSARLLMEKRVDRAFALVRPPGHHAMLTVHGSRGFCTINIESVMVEYLREHYGIRRVAIVDTDCHHGDGSQDIYWHDPDVLYISMHQDGRTLYPGTGFPDELGGPGARGATVNIPLPPGTCDEGFLYALDNIVLPLLDRFKPELIINSAGQDNHYSDPITTMNFSAQGYAELTRRLKADIAVLEGGYSIQGALPYVNLGLCLAMAGVDTSQVREPDYRPERFVQKPRITEYTHSLAEQLMAFLDNIPSMPDDGEVDGEWFVREHRVYYDTDGISERRKDKVRLCPDCAGVLVVECRSSLNPLSLGVRVPFGACPRCQEEGRRLYEVAARKGSPYRYVQIIDRVNKVYEHWGD
ncbi:histone deacetylase [Fundidesulfovibrio butyratiphilus]